MLGAEDFGFFAQEAPSCMIFVGTGGDAPMHNPGFQMGRFFLRKKEARRPLFYFRYSAATKAMALVQSLM